MGESATVVRRHLTLLRLLLVIVVVLSTSALVLPRAHAAEATVFGDGFESGTLSGYRQITHSGVQQSVVHGGGWAWRATNPNGKPSYAYHSLPAGYRELRVTAYVQIISRSSTVKLFGVRSRGGSRSLDVFVDQLGRLSLRNNIGAVTTYSTTKVANGSWRMMTLHATIGDGTGAVDVQLDGVTVPGLTLTGQKLGTLPFDDLRLGDLATAALFDIAIDDVVVKAASPA